MIHKVLGSSIVFGLKKEKERTWCIKMVPLGESIIGSMVSTLGTNYVGRGSNLTTVVWGGDLMVENPRDLDVPHAMSNLGLSGSGQ